MAGYSHVETVTLPRCFECQKSSTLMNLFDVHELYDAKLLCFKLESLLHNGIDDVTERG